ncbi:antigen-presenting glycoprotein CD1d-like isoform X1 [Coturnix japonica]|uniref:antigen-presenting glycoprotein CD1d-like isoform X1 n=2 Tax=Coturnix japonica TaxID=93934 RepID=UPI000776B852|nr:antigen-presenting glycoprotein CD1d-like isoform X1 [Coturnix japonica]
MQPHAILLLLFFFPGNWAEPEGSYMLKLLHFATFQNSTSMLVGGVGLLGDMELGSLDISTGNIHYYQAWLHPALPKEDWDVIESSIKSYVRDFNRLVQMYAMMPYPFVFQTSVGCELQSNRTVRTFFNIAYEGQNFIRFCLDTGTWEQMQHNQLSATAEQLMANASTLNEVIQVLLNYTCVDVLRLFIRAGKADLERQVPPIAVVFARTAGPAQLLLVCRVTSFYPRPITVTWLRDGRELPPSTSTVLPNADLTYQLRSTLLVSPRDGHSYACRVQHRSLGDRSLLVPWGRLSPSGDAAPEPRFLGTRSRRADGLFVVRALQEGTECGDRGRLAAGRGRHGRTVGTEIQEAAADGRGAQRPTGGDHGGAIRGMRPRNSRGGEGARLSASQNPPVLVAAPPAPIKEPTCPRVTNRDLPSAPSAFYRPTTAFINPLPEIFVQIFVQTLPPATPTDGAGCAELH